MSDVTARADALLATGQTQAAVALLRNAAGRGDPAAVFHEAIWTLIGAAIPRDLVRARHLLAAATAAGHADAALVEIALTANGAGAAPDWQQAFMLLRRAADSDAAAQEQLSLLQDMSLRADGYPADAIAPHAIGDDPAVWHAPQLFTPGECRHVALAAIDLLEPAVVVDPRSGRSIANPVRTSHAAVLGPTRETLVVQALNRRIAAISRTDWRQGEALTVLHYAPGQQFRPHVDAIAGARNQRVRTVLVYLNDGFEGGGTRFTASGLRIKPRIGDAIIFDNVRPDGTIDPRAQHAGEPVVKGVKWLATRWIRAQAFDPWKGPEEA